MSVYVMMQERLMVRRAVERSWLKRAPWLIRCTIDPLIHRKARINHERVRVIKPVIEFG